jgi:hypothetical protein
VAENFLGPGARDDFEGLFEACARFRQRHVVELVLARNAARESKNGPPARQTVEHGKFLGKPQRLVQRSRLP